MQNTIALVKAHTLRFGPRSEVKNEEATRRRTGIGRDAGNPERNNLQLEIPAANPFREVGWSDHVRLGSDRQVARRAELRAHQRQERDVNG